MFANVLIANRGEIACRITRTARRLGLRTLALATPADRGALFTRLADETHEIGGGAESYLDGGKIIAAARPPARTASTPAMAFCRRTPNSRRPAPTRVSSSSARRRGHSRDGPQGRGPALMQGGRAGRARLSGRRPERGERWRERPPRSAIPRSSRRSRVAAAGHAAVDARRRFRSARQSPGREAEAAFGDRRVLIEKFMSPRAMSKSRFSATGMATSCISSSATVRCSAAIKK